MDGPDDGLLGDPRQFPIRTGPERFHLAGPAAHKLPRRGLLGDSARRGSRWVSDCAVQSPGTGLL